VRRAVARHLERICELKASEFSTGSAEQALEVLLRVLKLFGERERKNRTASARLGNSQVRVASVGPLSFANCA
jgi:hypothetical protein